jgi:hypothetical protein
MYAKHPDHPADAARGGSRGQPARRASLRKIRGPGVFAAGQVVLVAEQDGHIVGMLELRGCAHIAMLFAQTPGRGIGRALYEEALRTCQKSAEAAGQMRAHASRYAVPFYRRLDFEAEGPERTQNGITYVPMVACIERSG